MNKLNFGFMYQTNDYANPYAVSSLQLESLNRVKIKKLKIREYLNHFEIDKSSIGLIQDSFNTIIKKITNSNTDLIYYFTLCFNICFLSGDNEKKWSQLFEDLEGIEKYNEFSHYDKIQVLRNIDPYRQEMILLIHKCKRLFELEQIESESEDIIL